MPRPKKTSDEDFVHVWRRSSTIDEVIRATGQSRDYCLARARRLRQAGFTLLAFEPPPRPLTARQREALRLIVLGLVAGKAHTVRGLAKAMKLAHPNAVHCHLRALERRGFVRLAKGAARAISVPGCRLELAYEGEAGQRLEEALRDRAASEEGGS